MASSWDWKEEAVEVAGVSGTACGIMGENARAAAVSMLSADRRNFIGFMGSNSCL